MAHCNELHFLEKHLPRPVTTVLEIGSHNYGHAMPWRDRYPALTGLDLTPGPGVDLVYDLMEGPMTTQYELVLCCSVLEHTRKPWIVAAHLAPSVAPGGFLYCTVPWSWRRHEYPIDYWRMSTDAIKTLFPGFAWIAEGYSSTEEHQFQEHQSKSVLKCDVKNLDGQSKMTNINVVLTQLSHLLGRKL